MSASYCSDKLNSVIKELKAGSYDAPFEVTIDGITYRNEKYEYGPEFMEEYWTPVDVMADVYINLNSLYILSIIRVICDKTIGDAEVFLNFNNNSLSPFLNNQFQLSDRSYFSTTAKGFDYHNIDGWMKITSCRYLESSIYQISGKFESLAVCNQTKDTVRVVGSFADTRIKDLDHALKDYL